MPEGKAELLGKLPFEAQVALCDGRDLIRLETENPFASEPSRPDVVRFVWILSRPARGPAEIPFVLPPRGEWLVHVIASVQAVRLRDVPSPHEDDRLSRPDR